MGARGPAKLPTAIKVLHGENRKERLNDQEPQPSNRPPKMPADMAPEAQTVWRHVIREMRATGVIRAADADALRIYCEAVARYREAAQLLADSSPLVRGAQGGHPVRNPLHQVVRDNAVLVRLYARELGLTPSARAGLRGVEQPDEGDELDAWSRTG